MKKYYALKGREMVVTADGRDLSADDFKILEKECVTSDHFDECAMEIEVLAMQNLEQLPAGYGRQVIREYFFSHSEQEVLQVSRAKALLEWRSATRYCGKCGTLLADYDKETARVCPSCGNLIYPRIEPCVIVLVHKEGKILLANHAQRNQDIYACLAGFVEAGESIEHAVEREIWEETHLKVKNIRYFGSQSWPFPSQLMLGFTADYESGEIVLQREEIADAQWFDPFHCPASPAPGSIAWQLIEDAKKKNNP